jgi:hypothetical protein
MTITLTDPARELADFLRGLQLNPHRNGDLGLADLWDVPAWSSEFYQIVFSVSRRIDEVKTLISQTALDDDQKEELKQHLETIRMAFGPNGLQNTWNHSIANYLTAATIGPLSTVSGLVRPIRSYPKLDADQITELLGMAHDLRSWLVEHQLSEQDFIRQALIEGLDHVIFRLERVQWLGWGYTVAGLKDVIAAYMALERGFPEAQANPNAAAMLKKAGSFVKTFYDKTRVVKDTVDTGEWLLTVYGGVMAVTHGQSQIAGLLS